MKTAVLGATGLVGRLMLQLLQERQWVDDEPLLLVSQRSAGRSLTFRGRSLICQDAALAELQGVELALFSAGAAASRSYAPAICEAGGWVIDNSSAFRMEPEVPLVVPEINPALLRLLSRGSDGRGGVIANPNCSTIQIALALAPLQQSFGLREAHVTTLQAVSGAGRRALAELAGQLREPGAWNHERIARGELVQATGQNLGHPHAPDGPVFPRPLAFNAIPQIGAPGPLGAFEEETKVVNELRKILDQADLAVTCTATRVPLWNGHSAAVRVVLARKATCSEAAAAMAAWPGLSVAADPHAYRTAWEVSGQPTVHVGRLRQDPDRDNALLFWVVADNLLKGAAWNALQIADLLVGASQAAPK